MLVVKNPINGKVLAAIHNDAEEEKKKVKGQKIKTCFKSEFFWTDKMHERMLFSSRKEFLGWLKKCVHTDEVSTFLGNYELVEVNMIAG